MDFGDILAQWDQSKREEKNRPKQSVNQVSHKKANAPTKEEKALKELGYKNTARGQMEESFKKRVNPMELWLTRYGTVDKDELAEESLEAGRMESFEYLKTMKSEAFIDLHGLTRDEAWAKLEAFVADSLRRGYKKIEIIHGKGIHSHGSDPVLGQMVRTFIEQHKNLGRSGHNDRNHGGSGVTWVLIK